MKKIEKAGLEKNYGVDEVEFVLNQYGVIVESGQIDPTQQTWGPAIKFLTSYNDQRKSGSKESIQEFFNLVKESKSVKSNTAETNANLQDELNPLADIQRTKEGSSEAHRVKTLKQLARTREAALKELKEDYLMVKTWKLALVNSPDFYNSAEVIAAEQLEYLPAHYAPTSVEEINQFAELTHQQLGGQPSFLANRLMAGKPQAPSNHAALQGSTTKQDGK